MMRSLSLRAWQLVKTDRRFHLAFGLFLIAGSYGPINVLMSSPVELPSWSSTGLLAVLSGALASSIYLLWGNLRILVPLVLLFGSSLIFNEQIEYYLTGTRSLREARSTQADSIMTEGERNVIARDRLIAGNLLVLLISGGGILVLITLLKQSRQSEQDLSTRQIARQIKSSFPPRDAIRSTWYEIQGTMMQGETASGDIMDIIPVSPTTVVVIVGSVFETGVASGVVTSIITGSFRSLLSEVQSGRRTEWSDPELLMKKVDSSLRDLAGQGEPFHVTLAVIDKRDRSVVLARRGTPPVFQVKPPDLRTSKKKDGQRKKRVRPKLSVKSGRFQYEIEDRIVVFSEELLGLKNENGEAFGIQRLKNAMMEFSMHPFSGWNQLLLSRALEFTGNRQLQKDISVVTIHLL